MKSRAKRQPVIEACVDLKTFGDGQHDLPMSDQPEHFFGNVERGQQGPLLVARGAGATLLAGERDEHL
jgi:hypothetical protein